MAENEYMDGYMAGQNSRTGDGMFSGNGLIWILLIFVLFGGGMGGWNMGGAAAQGALTRAEMYEGFNWAEVQRNQGDLMRGQFDVQKEIMQNRFDMAVGNNNLQREIMQNRFDASKGTCDTQKEIMESRYTTQLAFQNMQAQSDRCCCDLKTVIHAEGEATRALFSANENQRLRDALQAAQLQLGQLSQTQTLLNALQPTPRPAYPVPSPYESWGLRMNGGNPCNPCNG